MTELLVSPEWLKERLGSLGLKVVDASWYLPAQGRDAKAEFLDGHIPGAAFFDIDEIAEHSTDLPHMLPDEAAFAAAAGALGLAETDTIIVYDGAGLFSGPRVWWMLRTFGAEDVRILDGGLPAWKRTGFPLQRGEPLPQPATFHAARKRDSVRSFDDVAATLLSNDATLIDARSEARFRGEAPEPRPGLSSGHMPGARNLPFDRLVDGQGRLLPPERIRELYQDAGVDLSRPAVTTCGSGVTAALLLFALAASGKDDVALYDGSWAEWASRPGAAIVKGPA
jgi:thiosulfate/3-mercaptopyruvate sulfurtransferase